MKEGFKLEGPGKPCDVSECFIELESPEICEAMQIVCSAGYMIMMEVCDFNARKARLKEQLEEHSNAPTSGSPALKEAASQFNDALLDEQSKKIKRLTEKIARLNKIIHKKNLKIEEFRKESSRHLRGKIKMFGENLDLSQELCDKTEDIRLSKIREKNLTEVCQKYMKEIEELNEKAKSVNMHRHKELAEKDEVIADLSKELKAQKGLVDDISLKYDGAKHNLKLRMDECEKLKEKLEEANNRIKAIRNASKGYCDYGIAAEKMIQKMAKVIVEERAINSEDFKEYRRLANGYSFNPQLPDFSEEEEKKLSLFRDDSVGAVTNQKDCSPVKDTHPTEDNPEEVELDEILECVRKALEDGHTVSIDYDKAEEGADHSGVIVLCGKDFVKKFKENEDFIHDLFEKKHKKIKEFMSAEAEQLFEGDGIPTKIEVVNPSRKLTTIL